MYPYSINIHSRFSILFGLTNVPFVHAVSNVTEMIRLHMQCIVLFLWLTPAKSVQEKLAEAILTEGQCHSEPELSDTTTEEEEEPTGKDNQQNNKGIVFKSILHYYGLNYTNAKISTHFLIYCYITHITSQINQLHMQEV